MCIPLCADTSKLVNHDYKNLGHMYNPRTGRFLSQIIGSFYSFEKVNDEYGISLIGEARVAKRNKEICEALEAMWAEGNLNFSFEITAAKTIEENGVTYIDADEGNNLIGMAVVSIPAYPESKALALVAEMDKENEMLRATQGALINLGELSFEEIGALLYKAVHEALPEDIWPCDLYFREIYMNRAILCVGYRTFAVEYMIDEAEEYGKQVIVKDVYEVEYQRKEGEPAMTLEETLAPVVEEIAEETAPETQEEEELQEDHQEQPEEVEEAEVQPEPEQEEEMAEEPEEQEPEKDERYTELEALIESLKAQIAELTPYKERIEAMEAEEARNAEAQKKEKIKAYAQSNGLDVENAKIAEAIEKMDYEALVAQVMESQQVVPNEQPYLAGFDDLKANARDWLFQSRK